jgi:hypothetical protein
MMGLLSRVGKNIKGSFAPRMARNRGDDWSLGDYAAMPVVRNAPAMGIMGGMAGAVAGQNDESMVGGAAIGAGLGIGIPYSVAAKRIVMAVAKALKQQRPDVPEEAAIAKATEFVQSSRSQPNARAQIEKIVGKIDWDK